MTHYHAVMFGETGREFSASLEASSRVDAYAALRKDYPESRCVQLESRADTASREQAMHDHIAEGGDWDDDDDPRSAPTSTTTPHCIRLPNGRRVRRWP